MNVFLAKIHHGHHGFSPWFSRFSNLKRPHHIRSFQVVAPVPGQSLDWKAAPQPDLLEEDDGNGSPRSWTDFFLRISWVIY